MTISSASDCWTQVHRLEAYLWHFISSDSSAMNMIKKNYIKNVKYIKSKRKIKYLCSNTVIKIHFEK